MLEWDVTLREQEAEEELINNLIDHAIKDHGYTREYVMKPEMQDKIKGKIQKTYSFL